MAAKSRLVAALAAMSLLLLSACQQVPVEPSDSNENNQEAADFNIQAGVGYLRQQQNQRALLKFEKALQQAPDSVEAGMGKAAALQNLEQANEAEAIYKQLVADHRKRHEPASAYAGLLCQQQRFQEAEAVMLSALKNRAFASGDEAYLSLSRCALRGQRRDLAELYLTRAQTFASGNTVTSKEIALQQAWLAYGGGKHAEAAAFLALFESHSPLRADAVRLGYLIAKAEGSAERMATYSQILRQKYPQLWGQMKTAQQQ